MEPEDSLGICECGLFDSSGQVGEGDDGLIDPGMLGIEGSPANCAERRVLREGGNTVGREEENNKEDTT